MFGNKKGRNSRIAPLRFMRRVDRPRNDLVLGRQWDVARCNT